MFLGLVWDPSPFFLLLTTRVKFFCGRRPVKDFNFFSRFRCLQIRQFVLVFCSVWGATCFKTWFAFWAFFKSFRGTPLMAKGLVGTHFSPPPRPSPPPPCLSPTTSDRFVEKTLLFSPYFFLKKIEVVGCFIQAFSYFDCFLGLGIPLSSGATGREGVFGGGGFLVWDFREFSCPRVGPWGIPHPIPCVFF